MTREELFALTELLMVSDPWPGSDKNQKILDEYADKQSREHGFTDWIDAYHADWQNADMTA